MALDRNSDAEAALRRAIAIDERLTADDPTMGDPHRICSATNLGNLGVLYDRTGRFKEAERAHRKAFDLIQALRRANSDDPELLGRLANAENLAAINLRGQGRGQESLGPGRRRPHRSQSA
jgi:tetratricopeptide (TPR) repeat protein